MRISRSSARLLALTSASVLAACGSERKTDAHETSDAGALADAGGTKPRECTGPCPASNIEHLVVIVQENHTFDDHFGRYCTAPAGSNPSCNEGPACCEAAPAKDPSGAVPVDLTDAAHAAYDPDHTSACELAEMNGGAMDRFASGVEGCSDPKNVALANRTLIEPLWDLAKQGALADRWFQPLAGQSSANDMYFARAQFVFNDNAFGPKGAIGDACTIYLQHDLAKGTTIADLLQAKGIAWAWYSEGYADMTAAVKKGGCPDAPSACAFGVAVYPCVYDPSDNPFQYFASSQDKPESSRDFTQLAKDLAGGTLPAVSFVKALGFRTEHPGYGTKLSDGIAFVTDLLSAIEASAYAAKTLVLVTYDEGGGYFDHVKPPANHPKDKQPYGTRVPTLALGPFAKKNHVSHVVMEHSSVVRFIEWNWLEQKTGQLGGRDESVANLGSLLDPSTTGTTVPD